VRLDGLFLRAAKGSHRKTGAGPWIAGSERDICLDAEEHFDGGQICPTLTASVPARSRSSVAWLDRNNAALSVFNFISAHFRPLARARCCPASVHLARVLHFLDKLQPTRGCPY
jgi:hypothetical protein